MKNLKKFQNHYGKKILVPKSLRELLKKFQNHYGYIIYIRLV
nr:MAG TPA: hypothetical protein [Caudoviricetes sp.]